MNNTSRNVMIDLETLDNKNTSCILAIGAVEFNDQGVTYNRYYQLIDWNDAFKYGTVGADTVKWWMQQNDQARHELIKGENVLSLKDALTDFGHWFPKGACAWGNGSTFDISILDHAYDQVGLKIPWGYRDPRDVRTIVDLCKPTITVDKSKAKGDVHNALDDALFQAEYVAEMLRYIKAARNTYDQWNPHQPENELCSNRNS